MANRVKLTKRIIERLDTTVEKETWLNDSVVLGLGIRIRPSGKPIYMLRWKDPRGRDKKSSVGSVAQIDLDDARAIARQRLGEIARGNDPAEMKRQERRQGHSIDDVIEIIIDDMKSKKLKKQYIRDFTQQMRDYVQPKIGSMSVREVEALDLDRILAPVRERRALHNRIRAGLSKLFTYAVRAKYRTDNPAQSTTRTQEQERTRLLNDVELNAIFKAIDNNPSPSGDVMKLVALTGSRPQEVFKAKWKHFDLEKLLWTKPGQAVKAKRTHYLPLHKDAAALLYKMREAASNDDPDAFLFPSFGGSGHLTTINRYARKIFSEANIDDVVVYDLRKAFISKLVASGVDLKTVMSISGHTQINVLIKHYAHVFDGAQREALDRAFGS